MKVTVLMHKWKDGELQPMMQGHTFSHIKYLQFQPSEETTGLAPYGEGDVGSLILGGGSFPAILLEKDDEETK